MKNFVIRLEVDGESLVFLRSRPFLSTTNYKKVYFTCSLLSLCVIILCNIILNQ